MQDAFWVDIGHPVQYLLDDYFNPFLVDFVILARDELLQILLVVIKDYLQGLLLRLVEYLQQGDDVWMIFEGFEEGDLSKGTWWYPFLLVLEFDVFDCYCFVVLVKGLVDTTKGAFADLADLSVGVNFFHF